MPTKKSEQYTFEYIKNNVELFIQTHGKEPVHQDFCAKNNLPTARQIQRRFGGMVELRKKLGLQITFYKTGALRSKNIKNFLEKCQKYETDLYNRLYKKYHDRNNFTKTVTRQFAYQQWLPKGKYYSNILTDVAITDRIAKHTILIDFFMPQDKFSYLGCIRSKVNKLKKSPVALCSGYTHEVLFVCVNPEMSQAFLDSSKVNKGGFTVLSLDEFTNRFDI